MDKYEVAQILREIGILVELTDENPKKGLAYRKASYSVESIPDLKKAIAENTLKTYPGIGNRISKMISSLTETGFLKYYQDLKKKVPSTLFDLVNIPGLGINKIKILYDTYHVINIEQLEKAINGDLLIKVKGFGPSSIKKIAKSIALLKERGSSLLYPQALGIACAFMEILKNYVNRIEIVGALRRKLETISQIDLISESNDSNLCFSVFQNHGLVEKILTTTSTSSSVLLKQGIIINLQLVHSKNYYLNLVKFTGNEIHLESLEHQALNLGYSSLENCLKEKDLRSESELYEALKLPHICPELREGFGEIDAALTKKLPCLIREEDLRGIFHCHTVDSDGTNTLEDLIFPAKHLGWEYVGISDHSKSSYQAHGMDEERLLNQIEKINALNSTLDSSFQFFAGIECDVLKNGELDFPDEILKKLDFVIISIHRYFNMEEDEMTKRLLKAIENPYTTIVGHLTGRLLRHRDPYKLDISKIIDACVANDKIIELNASPHRLDMDWRWWKKGKEKGLKCSINPDAHTLRDFQNCKYGVNMARKGWLEKSDIINTLPLSKMKSFLKKGKVYD